MSNQDEKRNVRDISATSKDKVLFEGPPVARRNGVRRPYEPGPRIEKIPSGEG